MYFYLVKQNEFIELIKNPSGASSSDLMRLQDLKKQFPFFQSAHMLLSLVSKKYDSGIYQQTLRQTAISIPNRSRLHFLLNASEPEVIKQEIPVKEISTEPKNLIEPKEKTSEIDHLKAIELTSEKFITKEEQLNKQVEKEIEKNIINSFVEKEVLKTPDWYKKDIKEEKKEEEKAQVEETKAVLTSGSFSDWLQALKKADRVEEKVTKKITVTKADEKVVPKELTDEKKAKQQAIIDKIIEVNPTNIRLDPNQRFFAADSKAKESLIESEDLVTETLAKIYALQGNISKAIRAYEILSLKFPQKSAYFATLIQNLKETKPNK